MCYNAVIQFDCRVAACSLYLIQGNFHFFGNTPQLIFARQALENIDLLSVERGILALCIV